MNDLERLKAIAIRAQERESKRKLIDDEESLDAKIVASIFGVDGTSLLIQQDWCVAYAMGKLTCNEIHDLFLRKQDSLDEPMGHSY